MHDSNRNLLLYILKLVTLFNAVTLGWSVRKIDSKTYELSKARNNVNNFDLNSLLNKIVSNKLSLHTK